MSPFSSSRPGLLAGISLLALSPFALSPVALPFQSLFPRACAQPLSRANTGARASTHDLRGRAESAATSDAITAPEESDEIITAHGTPSGLQSRPAIGGRLGLTEQHTPASLSVITQKTIALRGYTHAEDAADFAPGVTSGGSPGNPAQLMMRGFSGNQVLILRDGFYFGPTTMVNRPANAFNLASVQIMKGPSSVLFGQGAVGGTMDMRYKRPDLERIRAEALVSYGSFNSWNAGFGLSVPLAKTLALRSDFSRTSSDGYVKGANPRSNDWTTTLLWQPGHDFAARLSIDYLTDSLSTYYGTPLVPKSMAGPVQGGLLHSADGLAISKASLWRNYNVSDPRASSVNALPTLHLDWKVSPGLTLHDKAYFLYAKRRWNNAETYTYIRTPDDADSAGRPIPPGEIGRDRFYVYQNQHQVGDALDLRYDHRILGVRNRVVVGADAYYLRFIRNRGFPSATYADSVSLTDPEAGVSGPFPGEYPFRKSPTTMVDAGIFVEDTLELRKSLRLVGGFRYDWLSLDRQNYKQNGAYDSATSFKGHYTPGNFRIGPVYDLLPNLSLYGVYTTAEDPPGSNLFLANRGQFTRLSRTRQGEIGIKGHTLSGRLVSTLAFFDIRRRHILVQTGQDAVSTAGTQNARGVEWSGMWRPDKALSLSGNVAYTHARYGRFFPSPQLDASGNQVPDVPSLTANLWGVWSSPLALPVDLGAGLRYVSARKGDYANRLTLNDYALVNLFVAWHARENITVFGRIDNVGDKKYVQWADTSYPSQILLGTPRAFSVSIRMPL
ncbi:TonB-dependent receptor [Swaminathania salitolerans]|uniref:TonB-dependent receptor n=1 Tax=Swaminathania salitolerans TaxID=182838 RepID=A0A511BNN9_9PROT|nr:TonB-dependent receptor [Swaminathania salitolerans]GBQ13953.1 TonB-dependent outermembrane receptor [Swaminathania salitolerans LMG 21291]GEL01682.1 TonB-dependent receptor [Swaminathania salitolerans]